MKNLKAIGSGLLGIAIFVAVIATTVLLFKYGTKLAFKIEPFINGLAVVLLLIDLVALPFVFFRATRQAAGVVIFISSFIFGVSAWLYGFAVTLALWGVIALIIGLFIGGVGVVPIGLLAAAFHGKWGLFWGLLGTFALAMVARGVGTALAESEGPKAADITADSRQIIDVDPVSTTHKPAAHPKSKREWTDIK